MKILKYVIFCFFALIISNLSAQNNLIKKVEPDLGDKFDYSYLIYIPDNVDKSEIDHFLVIPNNTGRTNDSLIVHEIAARKTAKMITPFLKSLNVPILIPIFPRPKTNWRVYTHALDRDCITTNIDSLKRLDLQLLNMIKSANKKFFGKDNIPKMFMIGFSASGMFVNRFAMIHPEQVSAVAIGSPGGMPMMPVKEFEGNKLRFPIGLADFEELFGKEFDKEAYSKIPQFFFLGDKDKNDSVTYRDSFDEQDEKLIFEVFGNTLQKRWKICEDVYKDENLLNAEFRMYRNIGHNVSRQMQKDIKMFFENILKEGSND